MRIARKHIGAGIATLFIASIAIQSLSTVQAERMGYVQAGCPTIVQEAVDSVSAACTKGGRNTLCYGNSTIQALFQVGAGNITFRAPGDIVGVAQIRQFTLGGMDMSANVWGMAEMKIKADLPDTDPTQNVTLILFGNVQLTDAANDANMAVLTQTPGAIARQNQYATATTRAIDQKQTQIAATATKLNGIEATATANAESPTPSGTMPAIKVTQAAATATRLAALEDTATAAPILQAPVPGTIIGPFKDLQAFYFQSSDSALCEQAPHDGILIQSPQGKQRVTLSVDGATLSLGSTVYITAQPSKFLTINTLEGSAIVTAAGQTQSVNAGTAVQVPLDANLRASGPPVFSGFYTADTIRALPTRVLPTTVVSFVPGLPLNVTLGTWTVVDTVVSTGCTIYGGKSDTFVEKLAYNDVNMWYGVLVLTRSGQGAYVGTYYSPESTNGVFDGKIIPSTYSLSVASPTRISGTITITFSSGTVCIDSLDLTLESSTPTASISSTASPSPAAKS